MELQPSLTVSQKLTLTPAMRQALRCLQLPIPELSELLQEEALSNPLLNAEPPEHTARETSAPEIREDSIWRVGGQRDPEEDRTDDEPRVAQEAVPCPIWNRLYSPCRCWTPPAWVPGTCPSV